MLKTILINIVLLFSLLIFLSSCGDDPAELMEPVDVTSYIHESVANLISSNAMILNDESFNLSFNSLTNYVSIMTYYYLQTNWGLRKMQPHYTDLGQKTDNIWIKRIEEQGIDTHFTVSYNADRNPHYTSKIATWGTYNGVYKTIAYQINYSGDGTGNFSFIIEDSIFSNAVITNKTSISNYADWTVTSTNLFSFNLKHTRLDITNGVTNNYSFYSTLDSVRTNKSTDYSFAITNVDISGTTTNYTINDYRTFNNTIP